MRTSKVSTERIPRGSSPVTGGPLGMFHEDRRMRNMASRVVQHRRSTQEKPIIILTVRRFPSKAVLFSILLAHAATVLCPPRRNAARLIRYAERLERLKVEASSTVDDLRDEFEDEVRLEELDFVDLASPMISDTVTWDDGLPPTDGGASLTGGDGTIGGFDVMENRSGEGSVTSEIIGQAGATEEKQGDCPPSRGEQDDAGGAEGGGASDCGHLDVPKPKPVNVDEPEWDVQGDFKPFSPWKVKCLQVWYTRPYLAPIRNRLAILRYPQGHPRVSSNTVYGAVWITPGGLDTLSDPLETCLATS